MAVILGLLILCLGVYFLGLFFQVARLEKELAEGVTLLERYMIVTYALGDNKDGDKEKGEGKDADAKDAGAAKAPAPPAPTPPKA
jgi:hypothetical protein